MSSRRKKWEVLVLIIGGGSLICGGNEDTQRKLKPCYAFDRHAGSFEDYWVEFHSKPSFDRKPGKSTAQTVPVPSESAFHAQPTVSDAIVPGEHSAFTGEQPQVPELSYLGGRSRSGSIPHSPSKRDLQQEMATLALVTGSFARQSSRESVGTPSPETLKALLARADRALDPKKRAALGIDPIDPKEFQNLVLYFAQPTPQSGDHLKRRKSSSETGEREGNNSPTKRSSLRRTGSQEVIAKA